MTRRRTSLIGSSVRRPWSPAEDCCRRRGACRPHVTSSSLSAYDFGQKGEGGPSARPGAGQGGGQAATQAAPEGEQVKGSSCGKGHPMREEWQASTDGLCSGRSYSAAVRFLQHMRFPPARNCSMPSKPFASPPMKEHWPRGYMDLRLGIPLYDEDPGNPSLRKAFSPCIQRIPRTHSLDFFWA